jgi:hydrogenase-4 component B
MDLLLSAVALQLVSGIAAFACSKAPRLATAVGAGGAMAGCGLGLMPAMRILLGGAPESRAFTWDAPYGVFSVELDVLGSFFLLPVLSLSGLAAVYGSNYLLAYRRQKSLGGPWFFFNTFVAGMVLVLITRTALLFLVAWEIMSVAAYFLVTFEHEKADVRRAGWIYLIATHLGVAFLLFAFMLLGREARALDFAAFRTLPALSAGRSAAIFLVALVGFGAKAGLVPFHVWLPEAHPAAPSHVSALMSGVMIKMGLYGLLRIATFLGQPAAWWGLTLAGLGMLTALIGIMLALYQRDMKRALAYSSIENIGLITLALGLGWWGIARHEAAIAVLGITAALLHIWNHALMKGLMFLAAGSVYHGTGTKDVEKLGGLMRRMPWTGSAMMAGAVAIAALPPLNGFVSKWLVYLSLIKSGFTTSDSRGLVALLGVGLLALVGALAAFTYVRLTGIVLLGSSRSNEANHAHESSWLMLTPMLLLIVACLTTAFVPQLVMRLLQGPLQSLLGPEFNQELAVLQESGSPLHTLGRLNAWIVAAIAAVALLVRALTRNALRTDGPTWGCGYVRPAVRMQYTGRSFVEMLSEHLLPPFLRPQTNRRAPQGLFPTKSDFAAADPDPATERIYEPFFRRWAARFVRLRILQQGKLHIYLIYIGITLLLALVWVSIRTWWRAS